MSLNTGQQETGTSRAVSKAAWLLISALTQDLLIRVIRV